MRDLSAGEIDIGILFSPAWSPDLYIEPLSSMSFRMVSTETSVLEDVRKESYIYASYSPLFERFHRDLHPELTRGAPCGGLRGPVDRIAATAGSGPPICLNRRLPVCSASFRG